MKTIQLKTVLLALNDDPLKNSEGNNFTLGEGIATAILSDKSKQFDAFKSYSLAKKCFKQNHIEIDDPDFEKLKSVLKSSEMSPIIIGQIEELLIKQ